MTGEFVKLRSIVSAAGLCLTVSLAAVGQGTVPVLMLSDLHFDPFHDPAKTARLVAAPVGEWDSILKEPDSAHQAEDFQAIQDACHGKGVDSDFALLDSGLNGAREQAKGIGFVTVTGDLLVHGFACRFDFAMRQKNAEGYAAFAEKTTVYVMQKVEATYPTVPVYIADGNNDSSCGDYEMDPQDRYLKATGKAVVAGLRGASAAEAKSALEDYEAGGYFGVTLKSLRRTRLLVLDDIYLADKYQGCGGKSGTAGADAVLAWLDRELTAAKAHGETVWVMGHIPPGVNIYSTVSKMKDVCSGAKITMFLGSDRLNEVLEKHADVVRLGLFGHTHMDEVRLLSGDGGRVPVKMVASISPVDGNRPTFTLAKVDAGSATLNDWTVFEASNDIGKDTKWTREYSYKETYHVPDFSAASAGDLIGQFHADAVGAKPASRAYETYFSPAMLPVLSLVWPQYACGLDHTTKESFKACVCGGK